MSLLETTLNTSDLGGKKTKNGLITISKRILRSDYNKYLPPNSHDINFLISNEIITIIDLRNNKEINNNKNHFELINEFKYFNYPIEEGSEIPKNTNEVSKSYMEIACSKNIKNIFETIANCEKGVMFHCSAGKDRTGVITSIIYMLCDVVEDEIVKDYMESKDNLKNKFDEIKKNKS